MYAHGHSRIGEQHLNGGGAVQPLETGLVDHAHAARAELFKDAVMGDGLAGHKGLSKFQETSAHGLKRSYPPNPTPQAWLVRGKS
jgi:hypothetical protein